MFRRLPHSTSPPAMISESALLLDQGFDKLSVEREALNQLPDPRRELRIAICRAPILRPYLYLFTDACMLPLSFQHQYL